MHAQDIRSIQLIRGEYFTQATTNRPSTDAAAAHYIFAYAVPAYSGAIQSATLKSPLGWTAELTNRGEFFFLSSQRGQNGDLAKPAPAGSYQFDVLGAAQAELKKTLALPGPATAIPPARIANFREAQQVDAAQPFTLLWEKIARRGAQDFLLLQIYATNGTQVFDSGHLSIEETNIFIPAGTLQPNSTDTAYLHIYHYFRFSKDPQPPLWATTESRITRFLIKTIIPAGVFRFSPLCVTATEDRGTATMTVQRTQGSEGEVTVDYFSTDGTGRANINYQPVAGTLTFPPGVTNQTFAVTLLDDGVTNGPLTVHFTLTNATGGAGVTQQPHADLTILDAHAAPGTNISGCFLARVEFYFQSGTNPPTQSDRSVRSRIYASVRPMFPGGVTAGWLDRPNGTRQTLSRLLANYQCFFEYEEDFPSRTVMNKVFPGGRYTLHFETLTDDPLTATLSLGAERAFSVPYLTNWLAAQTVDPAAAFTLNWLPFVGATTNDCVRVIMRDPMDEYVIYTADELEPGTLPGSTSEFTIPANTLDYGKRYFVDVIFAKMTSAGKQPGGAQVRTAIGTVHTTSLYLHTIDRP